MPWQYNPDTELNEWYDSEDSSYSANDGNAGDQEAADYQASQSSGSTDASYSSGYQGGLLGLIGDSAAPSQERYESTQKAAEDMVNTVKETTGIGDIVDSMVGGVKSVASWLGADKTRQEWVLKAIGGIYAAQEARDKQTRDSESRIAKLNHMAKLKQDEIDRQNKTMPGSFVKQTRPNGPGLRRKDGSNVWAPSGLLAQR